jgi:hypothetical protein
VEKSAIQITIKLNLSLDLSYSETRNIPLFTSNLNKEKNLLILANMELKFSKSKFNITLYNRNVIEPILFEPVYENDVMANTIPKNIENYSVFGGSINLKLLFSNHFLSMLMFNRIM